MVSMTSENHFECGACGTSAVADNAHTSDGLYDISGPLLLPPTIVTCSMTSDDHWYCGTHGTRISATSAHSSDGSFYISGLLLLPPTMVMGHLTSVGRCYYHP
jgi:hypothetical protein